MLVLSRKSGEEIYIGLDIKVSVLSITGGRVRLGLAAPSGVPIHREEIHRRIEGESTQRQENDSCRKLRFERFVGHALSEHR